MDAARGREWESGEERRRSRAEYDKRRPLCVGGVQSGSLTWQWKTPEHACFPFVLFCFVLFVRFFWFCHVLSLFSFIDFFFCHVAFLLAEKKAVKKERRRRVGGVQSGPLTWQREEITSLSPCWDTVHFGWSFVLLYLYVHYWQRWHNPSITAYLNHFQPVYSSCGLCSLTYLELLNQKFFCLAMCVTGDREKCCAYTK